MAPREGTRRQPARRRASEQGDVQAGERSWRDMHPDRVTPSWSVRVTARAAARQCDPEQVGRRFGGRVEAITVTELTLSVRDDLIKNPPTPTFPNFDVECHTLWWIGAAGNCAAPEDRAPVGRVVWVDPELDPRPNRDRGSGGR